MPSNYTGDPALATTTLSLMTGSDKRTAQSVRVPIERLLDNDAAQSAADASETARTQLRSALYLRLTEGLFTDTGAALGATCIDNEAPAGIAVVKADASDALLLWDDPTPNAQGSVASVTSLIRDAATNGARILVIGTGGALASYSDDMGGTWTASAAGIGGAVQYLVYSPHGTLFLCCGSGTGSVYRSTAGGPAVWAAAASGFAAPFGIGVLGDAGGTIVVLGDNAGGAGAQPRFGTSVNDGAAFSGSTSPPNAADADEPGSLAACPLVTRDNLSLSAYHVMRCDSGARLRLASSTDGTTWTAAGTIEPPAGMLFDTRPRLMICQSTGLMVIAASVDVGGIALYASLDFETWVGPVITQALTIQSFAVAGGRVFMTRSTSLYASDGVGARGSV